MLGELLTSASWLGGPQCPLALMVPSSWYGDGHQPGFSTVGWRGSLYEGIMSQVRVVLSERSRCD